MRALVRTSRADEVRRLRTYASIFGCPRSGTTFLVEALEPLACSEAIAGLIFPPHLAHLAATAGRAEDVALIERSYAWALTDFGDYASRARSWALGQLLRRNIGTAEFARCLRGRRELRSLIFKEPFLAFAPELPYRAIAGSRLVHIHRDGRDCADSLERKYGVLTDERLGDLGSNEAPVGRPVDGRFVPWWVEVEEQDAFLAASPYVRAVWMWREMVRRSIRFAERPDVAASGRVLTVSYEGLMTAPQEIGEAVVAHLGQRSNRRVRARLADAHRASIGIHRRRTRADIDAATALAHVELQRLGYAV